MKTKSLFFRGQKRSKLLFGAVGVFAVGVAFCVTFGVANLNTAKAEDATAETMQMIGGASIRTSDVTANRGMRFSAKIDKAWYEAQETGGYKISGGTFIMPYYYIAQKGSLNEANCFGDNAKYKWKEKEGATESQSTIIHVAGAPYLYTDDTDNSEYYRLNGSVVNMLAENLDIDYVGVSYLKLEKDSAVDYLFATSDLAENKRSTIQVGQNILLKSNIDKEKETATDYLNTYVETYKNAHDGNAPERTISADVYVNSSKGYVKSETLSQPVTVQLASADAFAQDYTFELSEELASEYSEIKHIDTAKTTTKVALDNSAKFIAYVDEKQTDVIIDSNDDFTLNYAFANPADDTKWHLHTVSDWGWHDSDSVYFQTNTYGRKYEMVLNETKVLEQPTANFSFIAKFNSTTHSVDHKMTFVITGDLVDGTEDAERSYEVSIVPANNSEVVSGDTWLRKVYLNSTGVAFKNVKKIAYKGQWDQQVSGRIDYFKAENYLYFANSNVPTSDTYLAANDEQVSLTFGTPKSTVMNKEELQQVQINATWTNYSKQFNNAADAVTALSTTEVNNISIEKSTDYKLSLNVTLNGETTTTEVTYWGYYPDMLLTFNEDDATAFTVDDNYGNTNITTWAKPDGVEGKGFRADNSAWDFLVLTNPHVLVNNCSKLSIWIKNSSEKALTNGLTFRVYVNDGSSEKDLHVKIPSGCTMKTEWTYYEFDLSALTAGSKITKVVMLTTQDGIYRASMDRIALK
ncbi:MAG: hypothetical protein KID07_06555 [Firmicutes bacterium]|nr:hypothetical protein [Bacillota bacterium]